MELKEAGIEKYEFLASLDSKTCSICGKLDGKSFKLEDAVIGVNCLPMHKSCRCSTIGYLKKEKGSIRIARNPETQKSYYVPSSMNYYKWNLNEKHLEITKVLVKAIKEGQPITYKELAINVGMSVERNSDLYSYLGDLSYYSFENGMPLISVMVVRKEEKIPGAGFYGGYKEKRGITVAKSQQMEVFVDELKRVLGYSEWDKLIELLKKEVSSKPKLLVRNRERRKRILDRLNKEKIEDEEVEFVEINELEYIEEVIEEGEIHKKDNRS
ncbi:MAG: minor capsid protein [Clostridium sp.]|nr:minor capsid protein [Clostridium sp.]